MGLWPFAGLLRALALGGTLLPLAGCPFVRTHQVTRTVAPAQVQDATLDQLLQRTDSNYEAIQSLFASIEVNAETGGERQGEVKEFPSFSGYVWLHKPGDLRLILQLPVLRSEAFDMVSDGKTFKLYIPPRNKGYAGTDEAVESSKHGLESVRPFVIRDALLVPPVLPDQIVTRSESSRLLPPAPGTKERIEEPVYELTVIRIKTGREGQRLRIIRFGRATLDPYEQEIYDADGHVVTVVTYDHYQKFGDTRFPGQIEIDRPLDEYKLRLDFTKVTINGKMAGDEFVLNIPASVPIQKM